MTTPPDDEALRRAFGALARHDARRAPELTTLVRRRVRRAAWGKVVPIASGLALAATVVLGLRFESHSEHAMSSAAPPTASSLATTEEATSVADERAPMASPASSAQPTATGSVLTRAAALGLTAAQRAAITQLERSERTSSTDLQSKLRAARQRLLQVLSTEPLDEPAALRLADEIGALEGRLESKRLSTEIRVRSALGAAQRAELRRISADAGL